MHLSMEIVSTEMGFDSGFILKILYTHYGRIAIMACKQNLITFVNCALNLIVTLVISPMYISPNFSIICLQIQKVILLSYPQCNRAMAFDAFFNNISNGADKIAVIGCGCSLATEPIAEISSYWNITHVSRNS